jgi:hypothetical protein
MCCRHKSQHRHSLSAKSLGGDSLIARRTREANSWQIRVHALKTVSAIRISGLD